MSANASTTSAKINFDKFGLLFFGLIPLVLLGFWKSYFSRFVGNFNNLSGYMHFHAILMSTWVALLIVQPTLIKRKKLKIHRLIGKVSYILMPLILVSMLLLIHRAGNLQPVQEQTFLNAILGLLGFFVIGGCYVIAILYRHNAAVHARAMVGTGLALLDPTLMRMLGPLFSPFGFMTGAVIILGVFIFLIVWERKQTSGRWVFPSMLVVYFIVYFLLIFQFYTNNSISLPALDSLMRWFYTLPLT